MSLDRFDGRGYRNWKFRLKSALQIEGIADTLDPKNIGSKGFQSKNQRALGHITRALADSHLHYVMDAEYACEVILRVWTRFTRRLIRQLSIIYAGDGKL